jgi:hypothetical protein
MKRTLRLVILIAALLTLVVGASARTASRMRANIPFAFHVQNELLPPGEYMFEMRAISTGASASSAVAITDRSGTKAMVISTIPAWDSRQIGEGRVYCNRYGSNYFLSKVQCLDYRAELRVTAAEKEFMAQTKASETVFVAQK